MTKSMNTVFVFAFAIIGGFNFLFGEQTKMINPPEWYKMLPKSHRPKEAEKIKAIEDLRKRIKTPHDACAMLVLSTPWSCAMAQYQSLSQIKISHPNLEEKKLWELVLIARLNVWQLTIDQDFETHEYSKLTRSELQKRVQSLKSRISEFQKYFVSFEDLIKFIVCMEEEMGNFTYPPGQSDIFDQMNYILGRGRPSKEDMDWYFSILKRLHIIS